MYTYFQVEYKTVHHVQLRIASACRKGSESTWSVAYTFCSVLDIAAISVFLSYSII